VITEEIKALVAGTQEEAAEWVSFFQSWTPGTEDEREHAAAAMREVHDRLKALEKRRKNITDPLHKAKREVDALFRPARELLERAKAALKAGLERSAAAQLHAYEQAVEAVEPVNAIPPTPAPGTSLRWDHEIVVLDEDKIPKEYWCLDWSALRIAAKEGRDVPGVRFDPVQKVSLTGGKR